MPQGDHDDGVFALGLALRRSRTRRQRLWGWIRTLCHRLYVRWFFKRVFIVVDKDRVSMAAINSIPFDRLRLNATLLFSNGAPWPIQIFDLDHLPRAKMKELTELIAASEGMVREAALQRKEDNATGC